MALSAGGRYAAPDMYSALSQDGSMVRASVARPAPVAVAGFVTGIPSVSVYRWTAGDRIDSLAYRMLGDSRLYWRIMDMNPTILDPSDIAPGTWIWVPNA